ncbi:hypothetical protein [Shumkonia mesophila]|uniref:hypothetical protein n=1 Tax=Shumkonia mesophila TaxID=2838854 RepID=UPI00293478FD|nr:hypothetical protein [Shumkonia mesophila]
MKILPTATLGGTLLATATWAGQADVVEAMAYREGGGTYRFEVAVRHDDTGWQHYADRWDILTADGTILASRELLHPHEDEQPFTRSLGGVRVPAAVRQVQIRAHDKVHGNGGKTLTIDLP